MDRYDAQFPQLHACAFRASFKLLGHRQEAEDIAQEACARAWARWRKVEGYAVPWVAHVAGNLALDRARSHDRSRRSDQPLGEVPEPDADMTLRVDLQRALRKLPTRQRHVVMLRFLMDQTEADVAAVLGITAGTVKTHAARGLAALRESLGEVVG